MTDLKNPEEIETAVAQLEAIGRQMQEAQIAQMNWREQSFFNSIPKDAKSIYIHQSHQSYQSTLIDKIRTQYGTENVLITGAPARSGQSFTDYYQEIEQRKTQALQTPLQEFLQQKSIDAVIYLCSSVCDGYQSPIFPEDVVTNYHIWHAIRTAQQQQKPLIVGYKDNFCFTARCPEREYITNPEEIKIPTQCINI